MRELTKQHELDRLENVIDIHPLDLGDILNRTVTGESDGTDILISKGGSWPTEHVEYQGKVYRQTVNVPVTSDYGKRLLASIGGK